VNQAELFHDTIYDALGADISAIGGFKVVAGKLWPAENPTTAATKLRNAINPDQAQKLCPDEILRVKRLAKEVGSYATVTYEARELGFDFAWIQPEDEAARIQRRATELMEQLTRELKRSNSLLEQSQKVRAIK
jgi:hypothetical protein